MMDMPEDVLPAMFVNFGIEKLKEYCWILVRVNQIKNKCCGRAALENDSRGGINRHCTAPHVQDFKLLCGV